MDEGMEESKNSRIMDMAASLLILEFLDSRIING